jgi:hypothetical protein
MYREILNNFNDQEKDLMLKNRVQEKGSHGVISDNCFSREMNSFSQRRKAHHEVSYYRLELYPVKKNEIFCLSNIHDILLKAEK